MKVLIIIKPGFQGHSNEVLEIFAQMGCVVTDRKTTILTQEQCNVIWGDIRVNMKAGINPKAQKYYEDYCAYIMSGEVECIILEAPEIDYHQVALAKNNIRKQNNAIRTFKDILHTSDTNEDAEAEIQCIFINQ